RSCFGVLQCDSAKVDLRGFHFATLYLLCFQTNCSVRDQLLSFYVKNVFSHLGVGSDKLYFTSAFQVLQANMNACVSIFPRPKLPVRAEKGIYKAIHELDILLPWIQAYIQTIV
uniref:Uncharacterized protein n=1 Tax=Accipiter nisus TaxID=211598 RepID=A0A8B9N2B1_9AVES